MAARLVSSVAVAVTLALIAAPASFAASPPRIVTTQWLVRVATGMSAGFVARAVDPDGDAVTLTWAFDDGTTATGDRVAHAWTSAGAHTGTVTATDATGLRTSVSFTIEVVDAALGPQPGGVVLPRPGPAPAATGGVALLGTGPLRVAADGTVVCVSRAGPAPTATAGSRSRAAATGSRARRSPWRPATAGPSASASRSRSSRGSGAVSRARSS